MSVSNSSQIVLLYSSHAHLPILCRLSETISATNRMTRAHKRVADSYIAVAGGVADLGLGPDDPNAQ